MNTKITRLLSFLPVVGLFIGLTAVSVAGQDSATDTKAIQTQDAKDGKATAKTESKTDPKKTTKTDPKKTASTDKEPTSSTVGDDAGPYNVVGSIEFGYRGQRVDGDVNKFKSDLNYKAGPRVFDSSFFMKSKDGTGLFDSLMVTSTGWGADPQGNMRISIENPKWYRFEGQYRRFKYYRFLNNIANPTWLFSPIQTVANPVTGLHGFDTRTTMGDFDVTILPKNELIRFNVGYSPERYDGTSYTNYHNGGNDFWLLNNMKSKADDWRFGADGKVGILDWTFLQGFRRFRDDSVIPAGSGLNVNTATSVAVLTSFLRQEPTRGSINYTRFSLHSLINDKLDITARGIYSRSSMNATYLENFSGRNFNFRITTPVFPPTPPSAQPNTTNPSSYTIASDTTRPSHAIDFGLTYLASDKFRISNTLHQEAFTIDGLGLYSAFFSLTRPITGGTRTDTLNVSPVPEQKTTNYSKLTDTIEGDYQINKNYSVHFGYRFGQRHDVVQELGFAINANVPAPITNPTAEIEENNTHAIFGGFKARFTRNWNVYFDAEHGTADNVFTRIGNYNYTNVRAKSRYSPNRKLNLNFGVIIRDNGNPSEIAGVNAQDFGVDLKTRIVTSSVDWLATSKITVNFGYNFNWVNSDAVIDYYYQVPPAASLFHHFGHALYYQRNNYFFADVTSRLSRRMTLFTSFRMNKDNGQGDRLSNPAGGTPIQGGFVPPGGSSPVAANLGGTMITSYPMNFVTPEARLAIMINRHLDWNLGYQYYGYNESDFLKTFPGSPRAQNYHAHLPYMSLRFYIGRKE
ncbi:MAG TPA: hypothetical protein VHQ64_12595 [Pyrinomonadaceae bacterium]|nr:hypothetical protein [Pyrinomonadaceae bacterium]